MNSTRITRRRFEARVSIWESIPSDIGYLILDKLAEIIERIRFSAVCKSWNIIRKEYQQQSKSRLNVLPLLLVPSSNAPVIRESPRIYALSCKGKYYSNLRIPLQFSSRRYYGSCYGWIVTQNKDNSIRLIYPFVNKEVLIIDLPRITNLYSMYCPSDTVNLTKLVISPDSTPENYKVVAIHEGVGELAMIKSGENSWVHISLEYDTVPVSRFSDIIFYKDAFYAVTNYCDIVKIDATARPPVLKVIIRLDHRKYCFKTYLVESTSSELYLIQRDYGHSYPYKEYVTVGFNVVKLVLDRQNAELVDQKVVKSINGDTFFIGDNATIAARANGCVPNSIYYLDDVYHWGYYKPSGPIDVGFFNVEEKTFGHFYQTNPAHRKNIARPIWIMPQHF